MRRLALVLLLALGLALFPSSVQARNTIGSCTVQLGPVVSGQQHLLVTGYNLQASFSYEEAEKGVQSVWVTTDSTGYVQDDSLYYYGPDDYYIAFYYPGNGHQDVYDALCSAKL